MNVRPIAGRMTALITAGVLIAGCGSSGSSSSSSSGGSGSPTLNNVSSQCLDAAKKITNADAQKLAIQACKAVKNVNTTDLKNTVLKECLAAAKQIPVASARKTAEDTCKANVK